ncbi:hypothetical protein [Streptomyces lanatus]|uniref:Integral membrane protein n=1 Tax=Streptomyces lanatus TaxID=66900 RepID=A0ABV1Y355_9ACTN|nr:hypothetical protein [Streptomyces lanatus]
MRANLDRADWREAGSVTGSFVTTGLVAGAVVWFAARRTRQNPAARGGAVDGPRMDIPEGRRLVWFSRTSNPWLHLIAAVTGLVALAAGAAAVGGLADPLQALALIAPLTLGSLLVLGCASVQAQVSHSACPPDAGLSRTSNRLASTSAPRCRWAAGATG